MMLFWSICIALILASLSIIALPLVASRQPSVARRDADRADAALSAIRLDLEYGLINEAEAEAAEREAQQACTDIPNDSFARRFRLGRVAAMIAFASTPLAAISLYQQIGSPHLLGAGDENVAASDSSAATDAPGDMAEQAELIASMTDDERRAMVESMVTGLAERLKENPDDSSGWRMLARSYRILGRTQESLEAWRELTARQEGTAEDWRYYAETLIEARNGSEEEIGEELESALTRLLSFSPNDPLALFILGQAAFNRGEMDAARNHWLRLKSLLPEDAPILATLDGLIEATQSGGGD